LKNQFPGFFQPDIRSKLATDVGLVWQHLGIARHDQDIDKSQRLDRIERVFVPRNFRHVLRSGNTLLLHARVSHPFSSGQSLYLSL